MPFDPQANDLTDLGTLKGELGIAAGRVLNVAVTASGSGYTAATVSLTGAGFGFVGRVNLVGGAVGSIDVLNPGWGWEGGAVPVITGDGAGATATASVEVENVRDSDAVLRRLISAASNEILGFINRPIFSAEETELYDGNELASSQRPECGLRVFPGANVRDEMLLRRWPVTDVTEVKFLQGTEWITVPQSDGNGSDGYLFDESLLYLIGSYRFPRGVQNISIKYTAGYVRGQSAELLRLEQAALLLCKAWSVARDSVGLVSSPSTSEHQVSTVYDRSGMPAQVVEICERFRQPVAA